MVNNNDNTSPGNETNAGEAKQERQQENDRKKKICVEYDGKNYIVKNEGDEAPMYESHDKEATVDFARKVAEEHNVEMVIDDRVNEAAEREEREEARKEERREENRDDKRETSSRDRSSRGRDRDGRKGDRAEMRRYEENRSEDGPRNVLVEDDGKYYIVRNEGDSARLYESEDKEATIDFARKMAKEHEVDLIVLDRDRYVRLEEKYNNGRQDEARKENKEGKRD